MLNQAEERDPVEVLGEDFLDRRRRGEDVTVGEYAVAYPELAEEIRHLFPAMVAMERVKTSKLSASGEPLELQIEPLEQLGDYRIIREIGRGGMGIVYEAEQQSLGRNVAVKVFPGQMLRDSRQLKRFHREARTAASLHHSNIVPVFGVGEQDGLHYFVMQRIHGVGLDEVISGTALSSLDAGGNETSKKAISSVCTSDSSGKVTSTVAGHVPQRFADDDSDDQLAALTRAPFDVQSVQGRARWKWVASVGIQVADAIGYAHAHGVLHRDVKPGNLLLDPNGKVWVTDFGLATVLQAEQEKNPEDVAGTLRFMAPEHLSGVQNARGDIYSLGLTLYELLTLQPAFKDKNRSGLIDKIISGELPLPRQLKPEIPRDLEAIVMKAITPDQQGRYENAESLSADLRRFIEGRPVHARRIGTLGRAFRWARRNQAVAALTAALLLLAFSSFVVISAKWREAVVENHRAEDNLSLALESMDQILERFASSWMAQPSATAGQDDEATQDVEAQMVVSNYSVEVLQDALKFYDQFAKQNETNPQLQRDTAKVHRRVADIYQRLGQFDEAQRAYRRCLEILEMQPLGTGSNLVFEKAATRNQLGLTMHASSQFNEAVGEFQAAQKMLSDQSLLDDPECQAELARTHTNIGHSQWLMLRYEESKQYHRQAVALLERLVQQEPRNADYRLALAHAYRTYFPLAKSRGKDSEQEQIRGAGIAIMEELVRDFPTVPDYQCELSEMLSVTSYRGRRSISTEEQVDRIQRGIEVARQLSATHPSIPRYRAALARALKEMAGTIQSMRRDDADMFYSQSIEIYRSLARDFAGIPAYHTLLAMALRDHARHLRKSDRASQALAIAQEGVAEQQAYVDLRPDNRFGKSVLGRLYEELAATRSALGNEHGADKALNEAARARGESRRRN